MNTLQKALAETLLKHAEDNGWRLSREAAEGYAASALHFVRREIGRALQGHNAHVSQPTSEGPLSPRQQEILRLIAAGKTTPQIAEELGVARSTVAVHTSLLFRKLGVSRRGAAAEKAAAYLGLPSTPTENASRRESTRALKRTRMAQDAAVRRSKKLYP